MTDDGDDLRTSVSTELLREHVRTVIAPGHRLTRFVRGGPQVAVLIEQTPDGWRATIDGEPGACHPDPALAPGIYGAIMWGKPCSADEYNFRLATADWARIHDPDRPEARPRERFDPATSKPIF